MNTDRLSTKARTRIGALRSRVLRKANGVLPYDYIVPNGVYEEQWDWVLLEGNPLWQPVPVDRDQAFTKYDGAAVAVDPKDPSIVYAGFQFGYSARLNLKTGERKGVLVGFPAGIVRSFPF